MPKRYYDIEFYSQSYEKYGVNLLTCDKNLDCFREMEKIFTMTKWSSLQLRVSKFTPKSSIGLA